MLSCFHSFTPGPLKDRNRLEELIDKLPGREKDRFNADEVLPGYKAWEVLRMTDRDNGIAEEQTWKEIYIRLICAQPIYRSHWYRPLHPEG